ncbi:MAG: hypothetical protein K0R44_29 [Thermomicrobiales bacterium]|jgi:hypothetical protein|nr:hypothetical protein [Thermomicrobiales bacterium]MDF3014804.1 hypothetical protein [Thermomicrobiales bacterium]
MPVLAPQIQSLPIPEPLPIGQAVDLYSMLPLEWVQGPDSNSDRWLAGVTFVPRGISTSVNLTPLEDPCITLENSFGTVQGFEAPATFLPFRVENAITCSALGGFTQNELEQWILDETRSVESFDLAKQVWGLGGPNLDLRDQADVITTGDVTPLGALSAVVGGLDRRLKGRRGLIHMSTAMLVRVVAAGAVTFRNGQYETAGGHRIVADAGYDGSAPAGQILGQSWIYGSGPVYYRMSPPEAPGLWWESFKRSHNDFVAQVVRYGLFAFDPAFVVGARSDVATSIA